MENLLLIVVQAVSDNRFWLVPVLAVIALVVVTVKTLGMVQAEIDE